MLDIKNLTKSFGARLLLKDISFHVNRNDRVGLVGMNGSGKSTVFRIITGEGEPDSGGIVLRSGARMGVLPQEIKPGGNETVLELAVSVMPEISGLFGIIRDEGAESDSGHAAQTRLDELRIYEIEPQARKILAGLGFDQADFSRPLNAMSGGWIMRAHLARLLTMAPELLLLDEPTNHLDLESLTWFQSFLRKYTGALLLISHDRSFMNALVDRVLEINNGELDSYRGNYDDYMRERDARRKSQQAAYENQQKEIAALRRFADRFRAKATKAAQAQSKLKQIDRMEKIVAPGSSVKTITFKWPEPPRSGQRVIDLIDLRQSYGEKQVYDELNFSVERGSRIALVGANGAGKSTLLKLLAGVIPFQSGHRELGLNVKVAYYSQHRIEMLSATRTVLEEVLAGAALHENIARNLLGAFLFRGDDVFKRVSVLSGGEKSRLALAKLLLDPPNFLLMDEPTTHLDIPSMDALIQALQHYHGTLAFISHDVYFIRATANTVVHVNSGKITAYAGNYDYYLERIQSDRKDAAMGANGVQRSISSGNNRLTRARGATARTDRLKHRNKTSAMEAKIETLETRQAELTERLQNPDVYADSDTAVTLALELKYLVAELEHLYGKWEQLIEQRTLLL